MASTVTHDSNPTARQAMAQLTAAVSKLQHSLVQMNDELNAIPRLEAAVDALHGEVKALNGEVRALGRRVEQIDEKVGVIPELVAAVQKLEIEHCEIAETLTSLREGVYQGESLKALKERSAVILTEDGKHNLYCTLIETKDLARGTVASAGSVAHSFVRDKDGVFREGDQLKHDIVKAVVYARLDGRVVKGRVVSVVICFDPSKGETHDFVFLVVFFSDVHGVEFGHEIGSWNKLEHKGLVQVLVGTNKLVGGSELVFAHGAACTVLRVSEAVAKASTNCPFGDCAAPVACVGEIVGLVFEPPGLLQVRRHGRGVTKKLSAAFDNFEAGKEVPSEKLGEFGNSLAEMVAAAVSPSVLTFVSLRRIEEFGVAALRCSDDFKELLARLRSGERTVEAIPLVVV